MMIKFFLIISLFCFASYSSAQTESEIFSKLFKSKSRWVPTSFILNNNEVGEAPVKFTSNKPVSILNSKKIFSEFVREEVIFTDSEMTLNALKDLGVELVLNEEKFYIEVYLKPEIIKEKTTSFDFEYRPQWVSEVTEPSKFSFYSNLYYYRPYFHNMKRDNSGELDVLPNVNFKGFVLESSHTYKDSDFIRNNTRLLYDFQKRTTRLSIGDSTTPSTDYLSGISILGVSYGKDFSLRPYDTTVPRGKAEFDLRESSTVRVFVNGTLINVLKLKAGTHKLEDLPLIQGLNEIKLVIETDLGRVDEIVIPAAFSQDLLKVGLSDFYYGVGKKSQIINEEREYIDSEYIYTGYYRRGMTDNLTLGAFFQADNEAQLLGADQVLSTKFGQIKTQQSSVNSRSGLGFSLKGEYFFLDQRFIGVAASGHLFGIEHRNSKFLLIDQVNSLGYSKNILSYAFNKNIYGYSYRIGGQFDHNQGRSNTWALTGSLGKTFKRRFNINTVSTYRTLTNGSNSFEISAYFSWFLPERGHNLYGSYNSLSKTSQASLQKIKTQSDDSLSYQFTARNSDQQKSLEFDSRYDHERFELGLRHSQEKSIGNSDGWNSYEGSFKFGTAVAYADNRFSFGKPISDSFAILSRDENLEDETILINSSGEQVADSSLFDNILLSKIQPYRYYKVSADGALLRDGLSIDVSDFALLPTYKSGSHIALKSKGAMSVFGSLTLPDSIPVKLLTFDILNNKGEVVYGSFTNRKGRILIEGLESGTYSVKLNVKDEIYLGSFNLPEGSLGFIDIGNIHLTKVKK
ncbi:hypothetical protein [Halobacteriovorax sp.]|uniref:hypothetical protein n=1 Tax=Halobacteriovorax sp. TaxID=2020862 RepID=UPI003568469C